MNEIFRKFAEKTSGIAGSSWTFVGFLLVIIAWFAAGFVMGFPEHWQAFFDNGTNILFLFLLLIMQNTQNRESKVIHLKLNELLRAVEGARTGLVHLEDLSDADLARLGGEFESLKKLPPDDAGASEPVTGIVGGLIPSLDGPETPPPTSVPEEEVAGSRKE